MPSCALKEARVELLLDIRAVAASRKKGFSKNQLAAHLGGAGIAYRHLRGLGTPKRGRDAAHVGDLDTFESVFLVHMEEPEAQFDLAEAVALARKRKICLLCLARDPNHCHRLIARPAKSWTICSSIRQPTPDHQWPRRLAKPATFAPVGRDRAVSPAMTTCKWCLAA
jgi:hypothetical protein